MFVSNSFLELKDSTLRKIIVPCDSRALPARPVLLRGIAARCCSDDAPICTRHPEERAQRASRRATRSQSQKADVLARRSQTDKRGESAHGVGATAAGNIRFEADKHGTFARLPGRRETTIPHLWAGVLRTHLRPGPSVVRRGCAQGCILVLYVPVQSVGGPQGLSSAKNMGISFDERKRWVFKK